MLSQLMNLHVFLFLHLLKTLLLISALIRDSTSGLIGLLMPQIGRSSKLLLAAIEASEGQEPMRRSLTIIEHLGHIRRPQLTHHILNLHLLVPIVVLHEMLLVSVAALNRLVVVVGERGAVMLVEIEQHLVGQLEVLLPLLLAGHAGVSRFVADHSGIALLVVALVVVHCQFVFFADDGAAERF